MASFWIKSRILSDLISRFQYNGSSTLCGHRTIWSQKIIQPGYITQSVRMPNQRGHSARTPFASSTNQSRARSCVIAGVPDKNESSRARSTSRENASAHTAAIYSSTDCPDRCAAVTTAASSSSGNEIVSIATSICSYRTISPKCNILNLISVLGSHPDTPILRFQNN